MITAGVTKHEQALLTTFAGKEITFPGQLEASCRFSLALAVIITSDPGAIDVSVAKL